MKIDLASIHEDGLSPYEKYLNNIKNEETKSHYNKYLHMFLQEIPDEIYQKFLNSRPDSTDKSRAEFFVKFFKQYPKIGSNIIVEYVKIQKSMAEVGEISPNTVPNYVKPIKILLDQNYISLLWKKIYNMYPREVKSEDRAYSLDEIQQMLKTCRHTIDKVIITMHASAGFRLEAWDYFTWSDVVIFRDEKNDITGGAVRIYHEDPGEYWTYLTPEACTFIELYKKTWTHQIGREPKPTDPLIRSPKYHMLSRLNQKGVRKRIEKIVSEIGLRPPLEQGKKRHPIKLVHGFRKFFNTMLKQAKVDYADKVKLMGHKISLEENYERYIETDFELFAEYQKAISFLTISDENRDKIELKSKQQKIDELEIKSATIDEQENRIKQLEQTQKDQAELMSLFEKYPPKRKEN